MFIRYFFALVFSLLINNVAFAGIYSLPDYDENLYANRTNKRKPINPSNYNADGSAKFSCSNYNGMISLNQLNPNQKCIDFYNGPETCCKKWICNDTFFASEDYCANKNQVPDIKSSSCTDNRGVFYSKCVCDKKVYSKHSNECLAGSTNPCSDDSGTFYKPENCVTDPCMLVTHISCPANLGCKETCGAKCTKCNEEAECPLGQHPNPVNLTLCINDSCPEGYATDSIDCGLDLSSSIWHLGIETYGYSGNSACYKCEQICKTGYLDIDTLWCNKPKQQDCIALGYNETSCGSDEKYISCPFNKNLKACYKK